jgi:pyrroline-5-carboxylate reductase
VERENIVATVRGESHAGELAGKFGIQVTAGRNREACEKADIVVLAVKPSTVPLVMREIREVLSERQILISLAASLPMNVIESLAGRRLSIFRAMPNIPVVVEEGAVGLTYNGRATAAERELVERIFRAVGVVCFVEEDLMDAVTALSGSGPAYVYMVIEALIAGGVKMGLSRETSTKLAEQTVLGAAKLVRETMLHPAILRDQVITPGGVTISAIHELEKHGLRSMLISAVETATRTSRERTRILLEKLEHHE